MFAVFFDEYTFVYSIRRTGNADGEGFCPKFVVLFIEYIAYICPNNNLKPCLPMEK